MDRPPTHADAELMLRLYDMRREPRLREARRWFMKSFHVSTIEEFQKLCPPGSEENASYRMVVSYWEMAASFVNHGILHEELFFENNQELLFIWERIRELVPKGRALQKNPKQLFNFEQVAGRFQEWWNRRAPDYYSVFSTMVRTGALPKPEPEDLDATRSND